MWRSKRNQITYAGRALICGLAALTAAGLAACAAPPDSKTDVEEETSPLFLDKSVSTWAANGNVVPICWEGGAGLATQKGWMQSAINAWGASSSLKFTFTDPCPTTGTTKHLKIKLQAGNGGTCGVGMGATFRSPGQPSNCVVSIDGTLSQTRVQYIAAHEVGHALGFRHEQDRPENEAQDLCLQPGLVIEDDKSGFVQGTYDQQSIMSYCGPQNGNLTNLDKMGVRQVYARVGLHLTYTESGGVLRHGVKDAAGTWSAFNDIEVDGTGNDIGTIRKVDQRYLSNGEVQLAAINSANELHHATRFVNGAWSTFGRLTSSASQVSMADVGLNMHIVYIDTSGALFHTVRNSDGTWQATQNISQGRTFLDAAITSAGLTGDVQVFAIPTTGSRLIHSLRTGGTWSTFASPWNGPSNLTRLDATAISMRTQIIGLTSDNRVFHGIRYDSGGWSHDFNEMTGLVGLASITDVAVSQERGQLFVSALGQKTVNGVVNAAINVVIRNPDNFGTWVTGVTVAQRPGATSITSIGME
jgi:hypothetical protein